MFRIYPKIKYKETIENSIINSNQVNINLHKNWLLSLCYRFCVLLIYTNNRLVDVAVLFHSIVFNINCFNKISVVLKRLSVRNIILTDKLIDWFGF